MECRAHHDVEKLERSTICYIYFEMCARVMLYCVINRPINRVTSKKPRHLYMNIL